MAAIVANTGSNNWNTNGAWMGGVQPTAADDVTIPASAVVTIPASTTALGRSVTVQASGSLAFAATTSLLNIGDDTAGAGNVALSIDAATTITLTGIGVISFISTSATVQTITSGGKTLPSWTINGVGSSYLLADGNTVGTTTTVTLNAGTLDTNGQTCSWGLFNTVGSTTRTLTLGSSAVTITGVNSCWLLTTVTGLTFNANTSTLTFSGANVTGQFGGQTYNNVVINSNTLFNLSGPSATFANLTRVGGAVKTADVNLTASHTITGTLTLAGHSVTNRLLVHSNTTGTTRSLTAGAVSLTNVDFRDITGAGVATPFTGTSLGNCLGNSGITFDSPVTQTATGTASFTWSTHGWTTRVPLPQDNVVINNAFSASQTITVDMPRLGANIDCSGATGAPIFLWNTAVESFGNVTMASNVIPRGSTNFWTLSGRGAQTITGNGVTWADASRLTISSVTGSYTLQDAFTAATSASPSLISVATGTFDTNNFNVTIGQLAVSSGATCNLGTTTWTLDSTATGNITNINSGAILSAASATFVVGSSTASRIFTGGNKTYGTLTYTAGPTGALAIVGSNTFNTLNVGSGRILTMPSSTVNTIASGGSFNVNGVNNGYLYLPGVTTHYVGSPDSAALSVAGDIDIRARVAPNDWTPAITHVLASKLLTIGQFSYDFYLNVNGTLTFRNSVDGTALNTAISTVATGLADGTTNWVRVTRNASTGSVIFYTAADSASMPSSWTQLGSTIATTAGGIFDGNTQLELGSNSTGNANLFMGKYYRAQIRNNILDDGSGIVFDADFTTKAFGVNSFVESSANAATVTINGSLAQVGDGRVSLVSSVSGTPAILSKASGTISSDYLSIKDSTATGGAAWYAGTNSVNVSGNSGWIFGAVGAAATRASDFLKFFSA